jgi:hypothetical protein
LVLRITVEGVAELELGHQLLFLLVAGCMITRSFYAYAGYPNNNTLSIVALQTSQKSLLQTYSIQVQNCLDADGKAYKQPGNKIRECEGKFVTLFNP